MLCNFENAKGVNRSFNLNWNKKLKKAEIDSSLVWIEEINTPIGNEDQINVTFIYLFSVWSSSKKHEKEILVTEELVEEFKKEIIVSKNNQESSKIYYDFLLDGFIGAVILQ